MELDIDTLYRYQVYGFLIVGGLCVIIFYAYIHYIYSSEKKGHKDYERLSNIVLDDEETSTPLETTERWKDKKIKGDKA